MHVQPAGFKLPQALPLKFGGFTHKTLHYANRAHNLLEKMVTPHSRAALSGLYSNTKSNLTRSVA
jgi:hypothetical protein